METYGYWLLGFAIVWPLEFLLFGMQRATLLISRNVDMEWRGGGEFLLPSWYPLTWLVRIGKWALLLSIAYVWDWRVALGLLIVDVILSSVLPIPYRAYRGVFEKKVRSVTAEEPEKGRLLKLLLDSAPF